MQDCQYRVGTENPERFGCTCPSIRVNAPDGLVSKGTCEGCFVPGELAKGNRPAERPLPKLPGLWTRAKSLGKALVAFAMSGFSTVSKSEYARRIGICKRCEFRIPKPNQCGACGCFLAGKARGKAWKCTIGRWDEDWAVGVTHAPRAMSYLDVTLASIEQAGWSDINIFSEPGPDFSEYAQGFKVHQNAQRKGAWNNWRAALETLVRENPNASKIMLVQDDTVFCRGVREWADSVLFPEALCGAVSLYMSTKYAHEWHVVDEDGRSVRRAASEKEALRFMRESIEEDESKDVQVEDLVKHPGLHRLKTNSLWGACALVFSRATAIEMLANPLMDAWEGAERDKETGAHIPRTGPDIKNIDTAVSSILSEMKRGLWLVSPSLSQHIGGVSSIANGDLSGNRSADTFPGPDFDARKIAKVWTPRQRFYDFGMPV